MSDKQEILAELAVLESRFDEHVKIYRENGIESKRVADALVVLHHSIQQVIEIQGVCGAKVTLLHAEYLEKMAVSKVMSGWMKKTILVAATLSATTVIFAAIKIILGAQF